MKSTIRKAVLALAALVSFAALPPASAADGAPRASKHRMVMQVSDADPKRWNLALNNLRNVKKALGDNAELELVAYGPGIGMLKMDSAVGTRVADAVKSGIKVVACENTMHGKKLTKADMLPEIGYVPAGVVELMDKQAEGWAYIRP